MNRFPRTSGPRSFRLSSFVFRLSHRRSPAFTLIELLVVIAIIAILISILLPALGYAKKMAYNSKTEALLTQLQTAIESYNHVFQAYPGPAAVSNTAGTTNKLSGSQNLLLGISYAMADNNKIPFGTASVAIPGSTYKVDPTVANGPVNWATADYNGNPERMSPFFDATSNNESKPKTASTWDSAGVNGAGANNFAFPVIVDAFPDGLPVLYYRRTPTVETAPTASAYTAGSSASYYLTENKEYTDATALKATSGSIFPQGANTDSFATTNPNAAANFTNFVLGGSVRGGYALVAAGIDRTYGKVKGATDDNVRVGGY